MTLAAAPATALDLSVDLGAAATVSGGGGNDGGSSDAATLGLDVGLNVLLPAVLTRGDDGTTDSPGAAPGAPDAASATSLTGGAGNDPLLAVVNLVNESDWSSTSFSSLSEISASTYDVNAMLDSENRVAFDSAMAANAGEIADLQAALSANAEFSAVLAEQGADPSGVVTIGVTADGSLAVFVYE
jgi:hypothetical protein